MIPSDTDPWSRSQDPGFDAVRGVARIETSSTVTVTDPGTSIDGGTQTSSVGNTNSAVLGVGGAGLVVGIRRLLIGSMQRLLEIWA